MNNLKNSSELHDTAILIGDLLAPIPDSHQYDIFHDVCPPGSFQEISDDAALFTKPVAEPTTGQNQGTQKAPRAYEENITDDSEYIGDRLESLLSNLCQQSGFQSAIVADDQGLPIGGHNSPIMVDRLAAFSSVLGTVIDKVPYFFEQSDANNISIDIDYLDKAVVRKFSIGSSPFFLLIICSQDIDERAYIELFSEQIIGLLER